MMAPLIERLVRTFETATDIRAVDEALVDAAFLFEKSHGFDVSDWSDEVVATDVVEEEIAELKNAIAEFVQRTGVGSWALGKCFDHSLKPLFIDVLRRHVDGDAGELFQAMIALDNLNEDVFAGQCSRSILDEEKNRALSREYLRRLHERRQ